MKRSILLFLVLTTIFMMGGCDNVQPTTTPSTDDPTQHLEYADIYASGTFQADPNGQVEESLHYTCDGFFGDVHPFYHDGKMYMFYLSTGKETESAHSTFSSLLAVSDDMIHYQPVQIEMDDKNPPEQDLYYALGVYVDAQGRFRSCYGKGSYVGGSVSDDLITWSNGAEPYLDETIGMLRYKYRITFDSDVYSGRDPYICWDKASSAYYCVVMNYYSANTDKGEKGLALYIGDAEGKYSSKAVKLLSFTGKGDPECPQLMKIGDRWYLFYSVYGTGTAGNVGRLSYRVGDEGKLPQDVDWENTEEYYLDGGDLHAAQLVNVGDKLYMYGWINYAPHSNVWGGYLNLPREVFQNADGTLGSRCDEYLTQLLKKERLATLDADDVTAQEVTVEHAFLTANITLPRDAEEAGFLLSNDTYCYFIGLRRENGKLLLTVSSRSGDAESAYIEMLDPTGTVFQIKVASEGKFIEAYVNDQYGVCAHTRFKNGNYQLSLSAVGEGAKVENAEIYALADYSNIHN